MPVPVPVPDEDEDSDEAPPPTKAPRKPGVRLPGKTPVKDPPATRDPNDRRKVTRPPTPPTPPPPRTPTRPPTTRNPRTPTRPPPDTRQPSTGNNGSSDACCGCCSPQVTGLAIGGAILGGIGGLLVGGAVGAGIGYVVAPSSNPPAEPDDVDKQIGLGVGAAIGAVGGILIGGVIGAGVGAALGGVLSE